MGGASASDSTMLSRRSGNVAEDGDAVMEDAPPAKKIHPMFLSKTAPAAGTKATPKKKDASKPKSVKKEDGKSKMKTLVNLRTDTKQGTINLENFKIKRAPERTEDDINTTDPEKEKHKPVPLDCGIQIRSPMEGRGLDSTGLPPISDLEEIFEDMVYRIPEIRKIFGAQSYRKLRVATMCSGTESPLLALRLIGRALDRMGWGHLEVDHVFSCEIEPYKQAYIERNFQPPILFRDIQELGQDYATTAYGSKVRVPGDIDILIAGTSCVDFSPLNNKRKGLDDGGESGDTFGGMIRWVERHRPLIVIQENVVTAHWTEMREWYLELGYSAEFSTSIDTKRYYIPHTRTRGYLMAINVKDSLLPRRWLSAIKKMQRDCTTTLEAFMLPDDDPRIIKARAEYAAEAENTSKARRTTDWEACQGKHEAFRNEAHLGMRRMLTQWEDGGTCHLQDYMWQEWGETLTPRVWDLLEINCLIAATVGYDAMYKGQLWELSQNVDRGTMGKPNGTSQCLTPHMIPFLCSRGGPVIGLEALSLQGLPINELLLTRESSKDLKDMAGNAMTSTVVGAAMLAALALSKDHLRPADSDAILLDNNAQNNAHRIVGDGELEEGVLDLSSTTQLNLGNILAKARRSCRMCTCEGRIGITTNQLQTCEACGFTSCIKCGGRPEHVYRVATRIDRLPPLKFELQVKRVLPMRLKVSLPEALDDVLARNPVAIDNIKGKDWVLWTELVSAAVTQEFRFKVLLREEVWTAVYDAPHGKLELILNPHQERAEWRLYAKCPKEEGVNSRKRALSRRPVARMFLPKQASLITGPRCQWQFCLPTTYSFTLTIEGVPADRDQYVTALRGGPPEESAPDAQLDDVEDAEVGEKNLVPAWHSRLGLMKAEFLHKKVWARLRMSVPATARQFLDCDISGEYRLFDNCGTACSSLHRKMDGSQPSPLFFFLDQSRTGDGKNDHFVFSFDRRRLRYGEERQLIARLKEWRQFSESAPQEAACVVEGYWCDAHLELSSVAENHGTLSLPGSGGLKVNFSNCELAQSLVVCRVPLHGQVESVWSSEWTEVDKIHERTSYEAIAWVTERVRSMIDLAQWHDISLSQQWSKCERCCPTPPTIQWVQQDTGRWCAFEDPQEAAPYERALKNRPSAFVTHLRLENQRTGALRIGLNVSTLLHRALSHLPPPTFPAEQPKISWRLVTDYIPESIVEARKFPLLSNKQDSSHSQPPNFRLQLRPEQLRSLGWMISQESDDAPAFVEEEVVEALLPQMAWRAEGRARRHVKFLGGVLADEVGYGKTVTTLGLIDCLQEDAVRHAKDVTAGLVPLKATLISIPEHLFSQWQSEITKFLGNRYTVVSIFSFLDLKNVKVKDIMNADIILITDKVFESERYLENLADFSGVEKPPAGAGRRFIDWHEKALRSLREQVDCLREKGSLAAHWRLESMLAMRRAAEEEEEIAFIQGKRKKGAAYVAAKLEARKAAGNAGKPGKSTSPESDSDEEDEPHKRERKRKTTDSTSEQELAKRPRIPLTVRDLWGLKSTDDWTMLRSPPLEMFRFNRMVVDEFVYAAGQVYIGITGQNARARWVLSGTPPLDSFSEVKGIADVLGIHLGVDDDGEGKAGEEKRKAMSKVRTEVERFGAFQETKSPHWHKHRLEIAQAFLNQFVRQNKAEIDEIPWVDHVIPIFLPAAERAIYLELSHYLQALDMKIRRAKANFDNDRDRRLQESLGKSKTAEEALLKRCSHFTDLMEEGDRDSQKNAVRACELIVRDRISSLNSCREDVRRRLRDLVKLHNQIAALGASYPVGDYFDIWVRSVLEQHAVEDPEAETDAIAILKAGLTKSKIPVKLIYSDGSVANPVIEDIPVIKPHKSGKKGKKKKKGAAEGEDEDKEVIFDPVATALSTETASVQKIDTLKYWTRDARQIVRKELCGRHRSLRFFRVIRDLQQRAWAQANTGVTCPSCGREDLPAAELVVLSTCGHQGCITCFQRTAKSEECIQRASGCRVPARLSNLVVGDTLGVEDPKDGEGKRYGAKLERLITLICDIIPKDEKILLFIQFPDMIAMVGQALTEAGVEWTDLSRDANKKLKAYQEGSKRVLILNITNETASGANLTNANHAIFLSPLLTETAYKYESSEEQAIGRIRRYGQTKEVHIWRFLTTDTIDFEIIEKRTGKGFKDLEPLFYKI